MKTKRFLAALLTVLVLVGSFPCMAFAADNGDENPEITSHTIVITVPAADPDDGNSSDDGGIMPCMWGQQTPAGVSHNNFSTASFYVSDPYFAFEASATATNGTSLPDASFSVEFKYIAGGTKASITGRATGKVYKADWISMTSGNYYFYIMNTSNYDLSFTITYYSW